MHLRTNCRPIQYHLSLTRHGFALAWEQNGRVELELGKIPKIVIWPHLHGTLPSLLEDASQASQIHFVGACWSAMGLLTFNRRSRSNNRCLQSNSRQEKLFTPPSCIFLSQLFPVRWWNGRGCRVVCAGAWKGWSCSSVVLTNIHNKTAFGTRHLKPPLVLEINEINSSPVDKFIINRFIFGGGGGTT